ncbi:nucleoside triphosphate pyrophosphohydrolase family protein [Dyella choica]|uniref:nucleoside triphosphate pyrophosphohydrolase family protein n=1 Tax=Dyella choica TaxID=1927959 RepID=UPI0013151C88|nr:nucleoside triphosphate pyrophosphohydrolase family protein [Dyella choica]
MTPAKRRGAALSLPEYALKSSATNQLDKDPEELDYLRFGFFGEVGGLLSSVKRSVRDQLSESQSQLASEELGDALWYLFGVAKALQVSPDDLGVECIRELRKRAQDKDTTPKLPITFRHIDGVMDSHRGEWDIVRPFQLGVLANAAGVLASTAREQLRTMSHPTACQHLGKILAEWALACHTFDLKVEDVAYENLAKTANRWPSEQAFLPFFDPSERYPEYEQFPRVFSIDFVERIEGGRTYVVQRLQDVNIGDRLTDNSNEPDDYRFHDVFHLAYVAYLGWSPVLRGLLKLKRKSQPKIDENEDGARATIIEEGIATWIFNHAKRRDHYENVAQGKLDYGLLKQIKSMVEGYEVEACPLWQWEMAILRGFEVFRMLKSNRGGRVTVNMNDHTLTYEELPHPT